MIECKEILALCDRFEAYLTPLSIHILRLRYNGKELLLPKVVGQRLKISDERVRQLEDRALRDLAYCLDMEANNQPITPIRLAKSFRQPVASLICDGFTKSVSAAAYTAHRGELIIFASRVDPRHDTQYPYGAIVGRVLLVDCYHGPTPNPHPHQWRLRFEQPETFPEPIPYAGQPSFFYISPEIAQQLPPRYPFSF